VHSANSISSIVFMDRVNARKHLYFKIGVEYVSRHALISKVKGKFVPVLN
jgi:hypothetical protein